MAIGRGPAPDQAVRRATPPPAVDDLDLATADGEYLVLLGPSGCGKTTLLRLIAGLEQPTSGEVLIGGEPMVGLPPRARKIAMVFQSYALYPHKTARKNIEFPLQGGGRGARRAGQEGRVGGRAAGHHPPARPPAPPALRRRAPAGGAGPGPGAGARRVPPRRAALQPRRQAAGHRPRRPQAVPGPGGHDHHLRHPRPGRGHGPGRPDRGDGRRAASASSARRTRSTTTRPTRSWPPSSARRR